MTKENNLTKAEKEMIVVATSADNNCMYCVVSHAAVLRIYSKNPLLGDQVAINWKTADLTDRENAILQFATKVGRSETIGEEDFKVLEKNGLDKEDAWDIGAIAAFFAMSNRLAHMTDMRPNDEYYLLGRLPNNEKWMLKRCNQSTTALSSRLEESRLGLFSMAIGFIKVSYINSS